MRRRGEGNNKWGATGNKCFGAVEEEDFRNWVKGRFCLFSNVHLVALVLPTESL